MKNKSNFLLLSTLLGGLLFNYLFWTERLALNLLIYSLYILLITFFNPDIIKSSKFKIYAASHILAAMLVVINNSDLTICSYYISLLLFIGFSHYDQIRTVFAAGLAAILQLITLPVNFILSLSKVSIGRFNLKPALKVVKYVFLPLVIVSIFTLVYSIANDVFAHYAERTFISLGEFIGDILNFFFGDIDFERIAYFCLGILLTGGLLYTFFNRSLEKTEMNCREDLVRERINPRKKSVLHEIAEVFTGNLLNRKLALKTEYIIGIISFIALNLLLLAVNLIDICTLWLGYKPTGNFSANLHQGTNALIFSIVLAMAVILYFFRGNLNFYSKSKILRILAFTWMIQNCILIISVLIRDGYYIEYYGLTHKRIGVLVFVLLCIIGLTTVYLKVSQQKTLFYLFKINGYIWFALLLAFSTINWDVLIVKYNIGHADSIAVDPDYLLSLSDKTLPFLDKNRAKLKRTLGHVPISEELDFVIGRPDDEILKQLDRRVGYFGERYQKTTWLSWNLQDWNTAEHFGLNKK
jgi:hypothetical protein